MDKNRHYKEISQFKNCKEIKFSNGGQYFAAVNGTSNAQVIHVYKFYTGENPVNSLNFLKNTIILIIKPNFYSVSLNPKSPFTKNQRSLLVQRRYRPCQLWY